MQGCEACTTASCQSASGALDDDPVTAPHAAIRDGAIAQLGERLHGMQEVSGSIPLGSTNLMRSEISVPVGMKS